MECIIFASLIALKALFASKRRRKIKGCFNKEEEC
jgi:hypothetical protein